MSIKYLHLNVSVDRIHSDPLGTRTEEIVQFRTEGFDLSGDLPHQSLLEVSPRSCALVDRQIACGCALDEIRLCWFDFLLDRLRKRNGTQLKLRYHYRVEVRA